MGYDYMLTAIREIATPSIRDKMEAAEALTMKAGITDKKEIYDQQLETLMNWAYRKKLNAETSKKMEIGMTRRMGSR